MSLIVVGPRKVRRRNRRTQLMILALFVTVFSFVFLTQKFKGSEDTEAASLAGFDPGYIISDYQMGNYNSMSEAEIQNFLRQKGNCNDTRTYLASYYPGYSYHIRDGHFVCLADETFGDGTAYGESAPGGASAAHIIWQAAQDYRINPQVLIVLLQKEQGLITDSWPNNRQYRSATGYGCPDTAPCSSQYYGFKNQVRKAAALFRTVLDGGWTNYPLGNNYIQYNPDADCGGSVVNIRSLATSALYRYTPYQPNAGALAAGYGTAYCGAYGNRNFYLYFEDWFGGIVYEKFIPETPEIMRAFLEKNAAILGKKRTDLALESDGRYWQLFEKGTVVYHSEMGVHYVLNGAVNNKWAEYGGSLGKLGRPKSDTKTESDGRIWQTFENGTIIYHKDTGAHVVLSGAMNNRWAEYGGSLGILGKPKSDTKTESDGRIWQTFENGTIIYRTDTGGWAVMNGKIADKWAIVGGSLGTIGVPINDKKSNEIWEWQDFEKGGIIHRIGSDFAISLQDAGIYYGWKKAAIEENVDIGVPISMQFIENDGRHWQTYENGTIIYHQENGAFAVLNGPIHDIWASNGGSLGKFGRPISNQTETDGVLTQTFLNGTIETASN